MDTNALGAEFGCEVAHRALQRGLGDAHDVVVLNHHLGHRESGPERAERLGAAPDDGIFVGNADDEALLAVEEIGFHLRDTAGTGSPNP